MKNFLFILTLFCGGNLFAQQNLALHFMDVWQQNRTNPAHFSEEKVSIGIASFYNNSVVEGFNLSDVIREENGENVLDIDAAIASMDTRNKLRQYFSLETINVGVNLGKFGVSLSHALRFDAVYEYPKTFAQVAFQGNAQFIDQTVEIGSRVDFKTYNEFALGLAYQTEKFNVGGRFKYLVGAGSAVTNPDRQQASIYTDPDIYQLTVNADYELASAGILQFENFGDYEFEYAPAGEDIQFGGNTGVAFDLGAEVNLGKLQLSASVLDLGSITWKENANTYSTRGTFTYDGLDISGALTGEEIDFAGALDTLEAIFVVEENDASYTTDLASQAYVSARYDLTEKLTVGALYYGRFEDLNPFTAVTLSGQMKLGKIATAGATYSIINDKFTNVGLNGMVKLGPVQFYALTENVAGLISQKDGEIVNFRLGLNVVL